MKYYYQDDYVTIYHGDCRDVLQGLAIEDVDGWVIDPPWDSDVIVRSGFRKLVMCDGSRQRDVVNMYGAPLWVFVWDCCSSWYTPNRPLRRMKMAYWYGVVSEYLFDGSHYGQPCGNHRVVTNSRGSYLFTPDPRGKHLADVYRAPLTAVHSDGPSHEKPVEWVRMLLANCLGACPTVIDPFAGTGTTGRAAKDLGRKAVLIEREERYCEIAAQRLLQEVLPLDIPLQPKSPNQIELF